jgi:hypothetical protein
MVGIKCTIEILGGGGSHNYNCICAGVKASQLTLIEEIFKVRLFPLCGKHHSILPPGNQSGKPKTGLIFYSKLFLYFGQKTVSNDTI